MNRTHPFPTRCPSCSRPQQACDGCGNTRWCEYCRACDICRHRPMITVKVDLGFVHGDQTRDEILEELDHLGYGSPFAITPSYWLFTFPVLGEDHDWATDFDNLLEPNAWSYCHGEETDANLVGLKG